MINTFILILAFLSTVLFTYYSLKILGDKSFSIQSNKKKKNVISPKSTESVKDIFLFMTPQQYRLFQIGSVAVIFLFVLLLSRNFLIALFICVIGIVIPKWFLRYLVKQRTKKFAEQLPDILTTLSSSLRAGFTIVQALDMLVREYPKPASQEFSIVLQENKLGVSLDESLQNLTKRIKDESLELVVTATIIARSLGGNLAEIFDRIESTVRRRERIDGKIKALTAQGKMQGIVVGLAPVLLGGILYLMNPDFIMPLFTTTMGQFSIGVMVFMELLGALFIRKIIKVEF